MIRTRIVAGGLLPETGNLDGEEPFGPVRDGAEPLYTVEALVSTRHNKMIPVKVQVFTRPPVNLTSLEDELAAK